LTVVTTEREHNNAVSPAKSHFFEHLLNPSFRQSLINDFVEMESIITQLSASKNDKIQLSTEHQKIIREFLVLVSQAKVLKSIEILTNYEYREQ
jgi:hypothetical protein